MIRQKIEFTDSIDKFFYKMTEGNPGAIIVVCEMLRRDNFMLLLSLDDMNIRGAQIWLGYKDYCKEDLKNLFIDAVKSRDSGLIEAINILMARSNRDGIEELEKAVHSDASYMRISPKLSEEEIKELRKKEVPVHPGAREKGER